MYDFEIRKYVHIKANIINSLDLNSLIIYFNFY